MKQLTIILIILIFIGCAPAAEPLSTEKNLEKILVEKAERIGFYSACARKAEQEGYTQASVYLGEVIEEEIKQLVRISVFQVQPKKTKKNLKKIYRMESASYKRVYPRMADTARAEEKLDAAKLFDQLALEEKRHAAGIKAIAKTAK